MASSDREDGHGDGMGERPRHAYLDLTVLPQMRELVLSASAGLVLDREDGSVLWANGEGAGLLGASSMKAILSGEHAMNPATRRQILQAASRLEHEETVDSVMRVRSGFRTRVIGFNVRPVTLPDGEEALLLRTEPMAPRDADEAQRAGRLLGALDGYSHASAVLDGHGSLLAASEHFGELAIDSETLRDLVSELGGEEDRLVKRPVQTARGILPMGIARISDTPLHALMVVADADDDGAATEEAAAHDAPAAAVAGAAALAAGAVDASTDESEDEAPGVGAFSNRRSSASRWYYRAPSRDGDGDGEDATAGDGNGPDGDGTLEAQASPSETEDETDAVATGGTATPSDGSDDPQAAPIGTGAVLAGGALAAAGLVQTVVADETSPSTEGGLTDDGGETARDGAVDPQPSEDGTEAAEPHGDHDGDATQDGFRFTAGAQPVRFVWEVDADGVFQRVSDDLARTVGPDAADVMNRRWSDVAAERGLDPEGEIEALLEKGDTWSGKTVLWPVDGTDMRVPTDLAGLPAYGRDRAFAGFNGFGILRTADAVVGDNWQVPSAPAPADVGRDENDNVVDLGAKRGERGLSSGEREAFSEIGDTLRKDQSQTDGEGGEARTEGPDGEERRDGSADAAHPVGFVPSAFVRRAAGRAEDTGREPDEAPSPAAKDGSASSSAMPGNAVRVPEHDVDTSILARLPIPVLVYRASDLLFANAEFLRTTGYDDLRDLAAAGGVETLFGPEGQNGGTLNGKGGEALGLRAHLQSVPWDDEKAMLLTLREGGDDEPGDEGTAPQPDASEPEASEDDRPAADVSSGEAHAEGPDSGARGSSSPPVQPLAQDLDGAGSGRSGLRETARRTPGSGRDGLSRLDPVDLRAILDTATDGVVVLDADGAIEAMNGPAEALFDIDAEAAHGTRLPGLMAPESRAAVDEYAAQVLGTRDGAPPSLVNDGREVIGRTAEGGLIPLFMTMGRLERSDGACAVLRDLTEWRKAEEDLVTARANAEQASSSKSQFLAQVSHEIRTPLNSIIGFCDLMIDERFGTIESERYRGYLRDIKRSGSHVLELVNDLLDISKIEAGKMEMDFDACDLNACVSETVALSQPDANKQRVIIRTSLSAAVPHVVADPRSLRQIILNLVTNAVRFTKQGGQVIVSTAYQESGEVVLRVRDTGIGMSSVELKRAMEPFRQVARAAESVRDGTGLGLPLTKAMVEANRAGFHIESVPDEGTLVEIRFPARRVLAER